MESTNKKWVYGFCWVGFIVFTYTYIYYLQSDLLAVTQHILSGGQTRYVAQVGTWVIVGLSCLLALVTRRLLKMSDTLYALNFIPSCILLIVMTRFYPAEQMASGCLLGGGLLLIYFIMILLLKNLPLRKSASPLSFYSLFLSNMGISVVGFALVGLLGNADDVAHYELRMQHLVRERNYAAVLEVGRKSMESSPRMTEMRAFALAKTGQLGEKLFAYPVYSGNPSLLPGGGDSVKMLVNPSVIYRSLGAYPGEHMNRQAFLRVLSERAGWNERYPMVRDYWLCSLLLQKKLDLFAQEFKRLYKPEQDSIPKYYREALTLYRHIRSNPVVDYEDRLAETNYLDFMACRRKHTHPVVQANAVRRAFGKSYYWYYFYGK